MSIAHYYTSATCSARQTEVIDYPVSAATGDVVLVVAKMAFAADAPTAANFGDAFTELFRRDTTSGGQFAAYYRILDGTEGASVTVTWTNNRIGVFAGYHVTNFLGETTDIVSGEAANNTNPPSVSSPAGSTIVQWIAGATSQTATTVSAYPSDYTDTDFLSCATDAHIAFGFRETNNAPSEDPETFTLSGGANYGAFTIGFATVDPTRLGVSITGIKEPNESDTLVTGVSNARAVVWTGDPPSDASTANEVLTSQSITDGAMELEFTHTPGELATALIAVDWDAGGGETKYFRAEATIVDLDA